MGKKKNIIKKEVFDREIALCKMLFKKHKGKCGWGKCKDCGVLPFLYKLYKGKLVEPTAALETIRTMEHQNHLHGNDAQEW